jgi:FSR family fosmidomycin resistance protein-like MFS transporter
VAVADIPVPIVRRMAPLTAGHAAVDFTQGALPALIPLLNDRLSLSYTQSGALILALTFASTITQPIFGLLADRVGLLWVLPASVAASGIGLGLATQATTYPLLLAAILVSGLGIAAYHPEGARVASALSGPLRARGMAVFSVGGNFGFALGPYSAGLITAAFGLAGGALLVVPAALVSVALLVLLPRLHESAGSAAAGPSRTGPDRPRALVLLLAGVTLRGYVFFGLLGFVALYEENVRGNAHTRSTLLLTLLLAAGAVGTLVMGRLADQFGIRRSMVVSFVLVGPLVAVYVLDDGLVGAAALVLAGGALVSTFSLSVVLSQAYLPSRASTAAGLGFGLSIGLGGMLAPVVGWIADSFSLEAALLSCAVVAVVGAGVTALMPDE